MAVGASQNSRSLHCFLRFCCRVVLFVPRTCCRVVENCQEHLLKCSKEYIDVNPTFKFARCLESTYRWILFGGCAVVCALIFFSSIEIMQHARQMFPQAGALETGFLKGSKRAEVG